MTQPIRALIAEDEPLGRRNLRDFMAEVDWILPVGEASDGMEAVQLIDSLKPDLVFLDVRMPELSGLEVLQKIEHQPFIVFTTAYDQYAVAAFELEALDYLLKPFSRKRFVKTLERIRCRISLEDHSRHRQDQLQHAFANQPFLTKIFVRKGSKILPLAIADVIHFQAAENYITLQTVKNMFTLHLAMGDLEKRLDPQHFLRVHRSHIINLDHIQGMEVFDERRLLVCMDNGQKVIASRAGSQRLKQRIV